MIKAYIAHAMTGRPFGEVRAEADRTRRELFKYGILAIDPIDLEEDILNIKDKIPNRPDAYGLAAWRADKRAIRETHVTIDITPEMKSEGVLRELGYARFFLWKPTIRVYKKGSSPHMITTFEDDAYVFSLREAAELIEQNWGTWGKRFRWRLKILFRSIPKFLYYQYLEFVKTGSMPPIEKRKTKRKGYKRGRN